MEQCQPDYVNLISAIQHVSLNHHDLLDVSLELSILYFKNNKESEIAFDKFWANPIFIEQTVLSAREGIVLAMQAIILDAHISFGKLIDSCIDLDLQRYNEEKITTNEAERKNIQDFLAFLRKELFSRIYSQNKELQKASKLPKELLLARYNLFLNHSF